ncbi:transporter substrate-binding domain-containing protein [uncultured Lamprocystis sp.]|jgi:polar amino acid transport system substrate-binding protein|uniref:transporter substrate-binding and LysM peptidoglycan-binding domain-containing protein n=1 Tax=uncultured Lamprocystis sp. TaxID=543132 RepID=UPI0025DA10A3|nr:transporter substrate-binding domain-containing protein [uncultured Lamprocystis sp.]
MKSRNRRLLLLVVLGLAPILLPWSLAEARGLAEIRSSGVINIGIRDDIPPIQYRDKRGELVGIDPDLGRALADALGVKPEWTILPGAKAREELLLKQKVDVVISSFSITRERLEVIDFSDPYFTTGLAVMIRAKDQDRIKSYKDLTGKTVTATRGSTGERLISELMPGANFFLVTATADTYAALTGGKTDALINDKVFLEHYASQNPGLLVLDGTLSADQYGIGVNKADNDLLGFINEFLTKIKNNGTLARIIGKYSKFDPNMEPEPVKTETLSTYVVKPGDTLSRIALAFYNDPTRWPVIYAANRDTVKYANVLNVGATLRIPSLDKSAAAAPVPPKGPAAGDELKRKLKEAESLYKNNYIDKQTYEEIKKELLRKHLIESR